MDRRDGATWRIRFTSPQGELVSHACRERVPGTASRVHLAVPRHGGLALQPHGSDVHDVVLTPESEGSGKGRPAPGAQTRRFPHLRVCIQREWPDEVVIDLVAPDAWPRIA